MTTTQTEVLTVHPPRRQRAATNYLATDLSETRGRKPLLNATQQQQLPMLLARGAQHYGFHGDFWTYERVGQIIVREFGVTCSLTTVRTVLKQVGYSLSTPNRRTRYRARLQEQRKRKLKQELAQAFQLR